MGRHIQCTHFGGAGPSPVPEGKNQPTAPVWTVGAAAAALWLAGVNLRFAHTLRRSRRLLPVEGCPLPVYVSQAIPTPCLFGLLRPCVYVTPITASDPTLLRHTLAHELTHFHHRDYLWSALRGVCLALHWYNPLVWLAGVVSSRDGELCCDEATVARLGEDQWASYGRTLLAVTCQGPGNLLLTATSMTGRGRDIKERILVLAKRPKTAALTLAAVVLVAAVAADCTFTGPASTPTPDPAPSETTAQPLTQEELDQVLEQYAGITTRDMAHVEYDDLIYLEEYDAWYNFTSDFAAGTFFCDYGTRTGNQVTLYSTPFENGSQNVLELEEIGDGFHILSHLWKEG